MKIRNLKNIDLKLYSEKLSNGLEIYIVPKSDVNNIYVTFTTKYGSSINEFIPINQKEYIRIPGGVAHFLEHKVFEQEDKVDPFTFFTKNGADANANTSNYKTTYLFSGPTKFKENLNYLLDFVQKPYFTEQNVEKEKGIIEQEIKMYDDMPFWKLYDKTLYNTFVNSPLKYPVAGKVEDILKINKEILYNCYNTFYNPGNMILVITGNVNPNDAINIVLENQQNKQFNKFKNVKIKEIDEPDNVFKDQEIVNFNIEIPKIAIAYKINIKNYDINDLNLYLNTFFDIKLGATSKLNETLKNNHLITDSIEFETVLSKKHIVYILMFESNNYNEVVSYINDTLSDLNIDNLELNRKKKLLKSVVQYRSDNIYGINSKITNNIIKFNNVILDDYKIIDNMNITIINNILNDLDFSHKTITIMKQN